MAHVSLIYDVEQSECYIVPFAINPRVGNAPAAAGPMTRCLSTDFERIAVPAIRQQLLQYSTNDVDRLSEFYDLMPEVERDAILNRSVKINVATRKDRQTIFLTSPVRGRNVEASVPWDAIDGEVAAAIQRFIRKVALIKDAI